MPRVIYSPWRPDNVIAGYQQRTVRLGHDDDGPMLATMIRKDPRSLNVAERRRRLMLRMLRDPVAIMYLHGWNDYFYRRHASEYWESLGIPFYAIDLRRYGRSLRAGQTPGYITDLHAYAAELNALRDVIVAEQGSRVRILAIAHSQGGLIAPLWMDREHPHHVRALALNSPWLELQGNRMFRLLSTPVLKGFLLGGGKTIVPIPDPGFYSRTIQRSRGGSWDYQAYPFLGTMQFVPRAGWLQAIFNGQEEISRGLDLRVPVLVATSDRSTLQVNWSEHMRESDSVLDIHAIRAAALKLGDMVTLATIHRGIHDLSMSSPVPRRRYFSLLTAWACRFAWDCRLPHDLVCRALDTVAKAERHSRSSGRALAAVNEQA